MSRRRPAAGVVAGLAGTFVLVLVTVPVGRNGLGRLAVLTAVVYAGWRVRGYVGVGVRPEPAAQRRRDDSFGMAHEQDQRLAQVDASLARAADNAEQFDRVTRPMLRRLVKERLRQRSGIDVTTDPLAARRQMGEELWAMFSTPADGAGEAPGPERLARLVGALERL